MAIYINKEEFKKYNNFLTTPLMTYCEAVEALNPNGIISDDGWNGFENQDHEDGVGFINPYGTGSDKLGYIHQDEGGCSFIIVDEEYLKGYVKLGIVRK